MKYVQHFQTRGHIFILVFRGYILIMEIYLWLALSCGSSHSSFDTSTDQVNSAERFAVTNSDLQESLDWFLAELGAVRLSNLLKFEADRVFIDPTCPGPFPGVFQTTAWNANCTTGENVSFEGRSQALYFENRGWEGETYDQVATFISAYSITSSIEDWFVMVNGYGDIRRNQTVDWMEVVGTFDQRGTDLSWPSTFQSIALKLERREEKLIVEGGISQSDSFKWPIVGILLESCTLDASTIDCTALFQTVSGERIELVFVGGHEDCDTTEYGSVCWDVSDIWSMSW